jgi:predicted enzyme related to lactoylglutathione lyase
LGGGAFFFRILPKESTNRGKRCRTAPLDEQNRIKHQPRSNPMAASHGKFHWNELMTRNVEQAKKFYADTLGWTYDAMQMPGGGAYWVAKSGDEPAAGIFDISGAEYKGTPESWMPYIAVDDVDARVKKATKAGAKVMKPAFDVPGVGRIVILLEPGGAGIGWMTPADA